MALKLRCKPVAVVLSMVDSVLKKMENNPNFTNPEPPLSVINQEREDLKNTLAIATDGTKAQKAAVKVKLRQLKLSMTTLKSYVQTTANADAENGERIALSSGMSLKGFTPRPKRTFSVTNTPQSGTVKAICPRTKKDIMFQFQYSRTPEIESSFVSTDPLMAATHIISGLIKGQTYFFRWATITTKGKGKWSDTIKTVVI